MSLTAAVDLQVLEEASQVVEMATRDVAFVPDRITAAPGEAIAVVLSNPDFMKHNFRIDDIDWQSVHVELEPRQELTFTITMADDLGEWRFYCSVPGHEARGMVGGLVVQ